MSPGSRTCEGRKGKKKAKAREAKEQAKQAEAEWKDNAQHKAQEYWACQEAALEAEEKMAKNARKCANPC